MRVINIIEVWNGLREVHWNQEILQKVEDLSNPNQVPARIDIISGPWWLGHSINYPHPPYGRPFSDRAVFSKIRFRQGCFPNNTIPTELFFPQIRFRQGYFCLFYPQIRFRQAIFQQIRFRQGYFSVNTIPTGLFWGVIKIPTGSYYSYIEMSSIGGVRKINGCPIAFLFETDFGRNYWRKKTCLPLSLSNNSS